MVTMPLKLIESEFKKLIEDKNFTYKRPNQFEQLLEEARWKKYKK